MRLEFKNSFYGYFKFYYNIIGNKFIVNLVLCIVISLLDGLGLAMFIPLLQSVDEKGNLVVDDADENLRYFTDIISTFGLNPTISSILIFLIVLFVLKGTVKFLQMNYQVNLRHLFIKNVRFKLVDSLTKLSYEGFLKLDAGKIQNTLTTEVQRLFQSMTFYFNAAQSVAMLLTYVVLAFFANYQFAFLVAVGAGLSNFLYKRIYILTKSASLDVSKKGNHFNGFLIEAIHYFKYLKSTNYFSVFSGRLKEVIVSTEDLNKKMGFYSAITSAVREPLIIIIVVMVIFIQITWMGSSIGTIVLSLLLFYRSLSFLMIIQNNWQSFIQSIGSMDAIASISNHMGQAKETLSAEAYPGFKDAIELKNVTLAYDNRVVIDQINLTLPKNKTIAFIGESGSGKTTLANLISGLIMPHEGSILVDGNDIRSYNLDSYRSKIGYISQEAVIFNDNIYNNITFWAPQTPENLSRFWEAIKLASLDNFILDQPQKELTLLGDNGMLVSGGQKQRISIARELYKTTDLLILDEATSALDSETEKVIQDNIQTLHGAYTIIIVAHRLSTIKEADIIYLLEKGKIIDYGSFDCLLAKSDRFKMMVSLQAF